MLAVRMRHLAKRPLAYPRLPECRRTARSTAARRSPGPYTGRRCHAPKAHQGPVQLLGQGGGLRCRTASVYLPALPSQCCSRAGTPGGWTRLSGSGQGLWRVVRGIPVHPATAAVFVIWSDPPSRGPVGSSHQVGSYWSAYSDYTASSDLCNHEDSKEKVSKADFTRRTDWGAGYEFTKRRIRGH